MHIILPQPTIGIEVALFFQTFAADYISTEPVILGIGYVQMTSASMDLMHPAQLRSLQFGCPLLRHHRSGN